LPSLLTYSTRRQSYNVGDYIQSLAARQFLPSVDQLLNREELGAYNGPPTKLILNGWFTHRPETWCPSPAIQPLFVSFHLNSLAAPAFLKGRNLDYLRRHSPIGCRDHHTVRLLQSSGIDAYFSGCLTLTLDRYVNPSADRREILLVDHDLGLAGRSPLSRLRGLVSSNHRARIRRGDALRRFLAPILDLAAPPITHHLPATGIPEAERFAAAEALLHRYASARLVITARIHCALPCLALGTPVLFVNGYHKPSDLCRFDGLLDLLHRVDLSPSGSLSTSFPLPPDGLLNPSSFPPNPSHFLPLATSLRSRVLSFLR
jgi:hypothetical protein